MGRVGLIERGFTLGTLAGLIGLAILHAVTDRDLYILFSIVFFGAIIVFSVFQVTKLYSNHLSLFAATLGIPVGAYGIWLASEGVPPFENTAVGILLLIWLFAISASNKLNRSDGMHYENR